MDRLVEALLAIREEIAMIERGELDRAKNPLKVGPRRDPGPRSGAPTEPRFQMAPHTQARVISDSWDLTYSR